MFSFVCNRASKKSNVSLLLGPKVKALMRFKLSTILYYRLKYIGLLSLAYSSFQNISKSIASLLHPLIANKVDCDSQKFSITNWSVECQHEHDQRKSIYCTIRTHYAKQCLFYRHNISLGLTWPVVSNLHTQECAVYVSLHRQSCQLISVPLAVFILSSGSALWLLIAYYIWVCCVDSATVFSAMLMLVLRYVFLCDR